MGIRFAEGSAVAMPGNNIVMVVLMDEPLSPLVGSLVDFIESGMSLANGFFQIAARTGADFTNAIEARIEDAEVSHFVDGERGGRASADGMAPVDVIADRKTRGSGGFNSFFEGDKLRERSGFRFVT